MGDECPWGGLGPRRARLLALRPGVPSSCPPTEHVKGTWWPVLQPPLAREGPCSDLPAGVPARRVSQQ